MNKYDFKLEFSDPKKNLEAYPRAQLINPKNFD